MDLNFRKEQFSAAYVKALAAVAGLAVAKPDPDTDSEDLILSARLVHKVRSPKVAIQLKCTSSLPKTSNDIAFALPIKNYDDLRPTNLAVPRLLIVLEVPPGEAPEDWIAQTHERLCLLHAAYWASLYGYKAVANQSSVTVHIPSERRLTAPVLTSIMAKLGEGERL